MADDTAAATAQIDAYLATLPDDQRRALQALREAVRAAAPEAVEAIAYGAPAFRYRGRPLVAYRAAKAHCAFFPMDPAVIDAHRDELTGFATARGTIRFTPDRRLPETVVMAIVRQRVSAVDARA
jgi:uncharacterized protein YdhG (YjbR/CyaY superfamily)